MRRWLLFIFLALILSGCGYGLVGSKRSPLLQDIDALAIPILSNQTQEPGIESTITSSVRNAFIDDGRVAVVDEADAQAVLTGTIREYYLEPIAFNRSDSAIRYRLHLVIQVSLMDTEEGKILLKQLLRSDREYQVGGQVADTNVARLAALDLAAQDFARELSSLIMEGF